MNCELTDPRRLTELQAKFVYAFTNIEGCIGNASAAARHAGYSEESARVVGYQLLHKAHVLAAIDRANRELIGGELASKAVNVLKKIIDDPKAPDKLKLEAAKTILDRAGLIAPKAPEAPDLTDKDTTEMTMAELQAAIRKIDAEIERTKAEVIDITPGTPAAAPLALEAPPTPLTS